LLEDSSLAGFEQRVEPADDHHGEDDVAIFAAHINVAKDIVGDAPNEVGDPIKLG